MTKRRKKIAIGILSAAFIMCTGMYLTGITASALGRGTVFRTDKITRTNELLSEEYKQNYAIGTDASADLYIRSYSNNGGNYPNNVLSRAFDGNFDTFWETNTVNSDTFKNTVTVEFSDTAEVDRLIFATRRDDWAKGFPKTATFSVSDDGADYTVIGTGVSEVCDNVLLYTFDRAYSFRYFRFEYTQVNTSKTQHCSASEFVFYRPEEACVQTLQNGLFTDYNYLTRDASYSKSETEDLLAQVRETAAYRLRDTVRFLSDRAESVLRGEISYDGKRELSTAKDENGNATLARHGDVAGYARNTLKMVWMGTNRQVTGICAAPGETITVFVDCADGDPLPTLNFTQQIGHWNKWYSGATVLNRGINRIPVPDLYDSSWSVATVPGGPIYLRNPYTEAEQSDSVRIYIEGGYEIPTYREGDDEAAYKRELTEYLERCESQPDTLCDVTELQGKNITLTVTATVAKQVYIDSSVSPAKACAGWDEYLRGLYAFAGVSFDPKDEHYDARGEYLNVNVRVMQPHAAAYAYTEHVGIQKGSGWETTSCQGSDFGWGMSHELGHMMDISERTRSEVTNNMWSQYNKTAQNGESARGDFTSYLAATAPDDNAGNAYTQKASDALPWWCIESRYPGYWGNLENCYRFENRAGISAASELHVYFSSLAAGTDLSYYFARIGFEWGGKAFTGYDSASEQFKAAMDAAKKSGRIKDNPLKLWYADAAFYNYYTRYGDELAIYDGSDRTEILHVVRSAGGNTLILPETDNFAHLGYEVLRGDDQSGYQVIGFTYGRTYTDAAGPESGAYYKVRAYDRALGAGAESAAVGLDEEKTVARLNGSNFTTLAAALAQATAGDTVYIVEDVYETGLTVSVNGLTILPEGKDVSVFRTGYKALFTVASGASLSIAGAQGHTVTLDGLGVSSGEPMIASAGTLTIGEGAVLQNGRTTGNGGAVRVTGGKLIVSGAVFRENAANNGGAIACETASSQVTLTGAQFTGNTSSKNGGAIVGTCTINLNDCLFRSNAAQQDGGAVCLWGGGILNVNGGIYGENEAASSGGAFWLDGKTQFARYDGAENSAVPTLTGNRAKTGGGVYTQGTNARVVTLLCVNISDNTASGGAAVCFNGTVRVGGSGGDVTIRGDLNADTVRYGQNAEVKYEGGGLTLIGGVSLAEGKRLTFTAMPQADAGKVEIAFLLAEDWGRAQPIILFPDRASALENPFSVQVYLGGEAFGFIVDEQTSAYIVGYLWKVTDGEETRFMSVGAGTQMQFPECAGMEGYRFMGWRVGDKLYQPKDVITVTDDVIAAAEYKKIYLLSFEGTAVLEAVEGERVELPDGEDKDGETFLGWVAGGKRYSGAIILSEELIALAEDGRISFRADYFSADGSVVAGEDGDYLTYIGIGVGAALVCAAAVMAIVLLRKKKK